MEKFLGESKVIMGQIVFRMASISSECILKIKNPG
jgi:hypothetical protein